MEREMTRLTQRTWGNMRWKLDVLFDGTLTLFNRTLNLSIGVMACEEISMRSVQIINALTPPCKDRSEWNRE